MIVMLLVVLIVSACQPAAPPAAAPAVEEAAPAEEEAEAPAGFDWKRFEGSEITLLFNQHPWTDELRLYIDDFEELTGIKADIQSFAEDLYWDKMELALRSEQPVADVYWEPMEAVSFNQWSDGLIAPLSPYLNDPTMTSPDYDLEDFPEGFRAVSTYPPGESDAQLHGIPITFEVYILFYNKEMVDQYLDGQVPQTMPDLIEAAQMITAEGNGEDFGSVMRGQRDTITTDFISALVYNNLDGEKIPLPYGMFFEGDWAKPRFTDPRIVTGFTQYADLLKAGPPGTLAMDWYEAKRTFEEGHVAFFIDCSLFSPMFENPDESPIAGNVGYAVMPVAEEGDTTSYSTHWMWGLGIPENSENKEAAWYFIQWITSKEMEPKMGIAHGGPARMSTWANPDYSATLHPDYIKVTEIAMQTSQPAAVFYEHWAEVALGITDATHAIYNGQDPVEALQDLEDMTLEFVVE